MNKDRLLTDSTKEDLQQARQNLFIVTQAKGFKKMESTTQQKENQYKKILEELQQESNLKGEVAAMLLNEVSDHDDDTIKGFMEDVLKHGCVSGMVGGLIYYCDTIKFYDDNDDDIENLIYESMQEFGYKNRFEFIGSLNGSDSVGDMTQEKNLLSWFAFEETTRDIFINDLGVNW